jgi:lambda family phage minor tail protein L
MSREQAKLDGTYPLELYAINASLTGDQKLYYVNLNQDVVGYVVNATGDMTNATVLYTGLPVGRQDMSTNIKGEITGVQLSIPNTDRTMESLIQNYDYLRGREVYVMTMFAKHLPKSDTGEDANYIGDDPDYNSVIKEKFYIDSTTSTEQAVTFICKSKFDIRSVVIPMRKFTPECQWQLHGNYLGTECDPLNIINSTTYPKCDGTISNCKERGNLPRYGGFPSVPTRGHS